MDSYLQLATSSTPATILYLVDISASMDKRLGNQRRIDITFNALRKTIKKILSRSTKGEDIQPRYRIGIYAYSNGILDMLGGIKTINELSKFSLPTPEPQSKTETAMAFNLAFQILSTQMPYLDNCPAPLICHLTDDEYTGDNPTPFVDSLKKLSNKDGHVLIENIYISEKFNLPSTITDWKGVSKTQVMSDPYANILRDWSSPIPISYHNMMVEMGYSIQPNSALLLPGINPELVQLGFQISSVTGATKV